MRKRLLSLLLLFSTVSFAQNNLSGSLTGSALTYIYKIDWREARVLYKTDMDKVFEAYLHTLVDSFEKEEPLLKPGNYLFVQAVSNRLQFALRAIGDMTPKFINNNRDLVVALHTKEGTLLSNADVSVGNKVLHYNAATQTYRREGFKKDGLLQVIYKGVLYVFPVEKNVVRKQSFTQKLVQAPPIKYLVQPLRKLFSKRPSRYNNFSYRTENEQHFKGFLVCNKPKYKPGDTVRVKAFVTNSKGKPYEDKLLLRLFNRGLDVDTIIAVINPYRAGGFEHSFVLSDSLDIDLDEEYQLTLEEESSRKIGLKKRGGDRTDEEDADKRKVVMRGRFKYEEYELNEVTFSVRSDKKEHSRGEELALYVKASDASGLAVMDGRVEIIVKPSGQKTFAAPIVFLPDTLWQHEVPMEAVGETRINLPDSIFPRASFSYQIDCIFLNAANERQTQALYQTFHDEPERISFAMAGDSLQIDRLVKGKSVPDEATLYSFTAKDDTLTQQAIRLPATVRVNPFATRYEVETKTLDEDYDIEASHLVSAQASRTKDSVFIRLINPSGLPVWYTVFADNKVLLRGFGDSLLYTTRATTAKNYFLSLQYIFKDKVYNEEYTIPYRNKLLSIAVSQPEAVYPGQTTTVSLTVTDAQHKPVSDADVTAWAFTSKFENAPSPFVPYLGKAYPGRKRYAMFRDGEEKEYSNSIRLVWERWSREMKLDTVEYYKFLHPATLYVNTEPAPDSLTQLSPFVVKDGQLQPVHQLYIDEVPVYFSAAQQLQRYSFSLSPGRHSLRLRTQNSLIRLDSIVIKYGVKTFLSINAGTANHSITVQKLPDTLTAYEKGLWGKYMLLVQKNYGENYSYVNSGAGLFFLPPSSPVNPVLVGPLPNEYAELVVKRKFSQRFEAESGYHYFISKGFVKQKQLRTPYPFSSFLSSVPPKFNFRDYVLTEKEIDSLWQEYLYNRSASVDLFTNYWLNAEGNGALQIGLKKDTTGKELFIRNIFIFKYNDPDYLRIFRGNARDLGYLQPGKYRLLFLLRDDAYFIRDSIVVRKDGINYYEILPSPVHQKDSVSSHISAVVNAKESGHYGYNESDFNGIKESFNERYFDISQLNETVSGVVRDEHGVPIVGASVYLKGTSKGTMTDVTGRFSLRVIQSGTLVINSVGYTGQEVRIKSDAEYAITLNASKQSLSEVVVVGYGTAKRSELTGSVSGVSVNGFAGGDLFIRGAVTLDSTKIPLLIVDGVPFSGKLDDINPGLIASTTVLKDAAATAIYGQQAANGVVIITTKAGTQTLTGDGLQQAANSLRRNFRDYAYWQPTLRTNAEGKASFTVTYPDDMTAWRTFAIAMTGNKQSGYVEGMVRSFKAISGALSMPQFAVAGDSLTVIGKSLNYGMDSIEAKRSFYVADKLAKENLLRFRNSWIDSFSVVAAGDSLKLKYTLQKPNGYFDGEERVVPVFRAGVLETTGVFAALRKDTAFTLQPLSDTGTVKIYAEASVLPTLEKEVEALQAYEYLCNEQLASKLKGLLVQKKIDSLLKRPFRGDKAVRDIIAKLSQSKAASGLWGWWKESEPAMWISLHVLEALVQASAQGYNVPLNKTALMDYLVFHLESGHEAESILALHLLHLLGARVDYGRYIDSLQKHLPKMNLYEKLRLLELKQKAGLDYSIDSLLARQSHTMLGNAYWGEEGYRFFDNSIQNTIVAYRILKMKGGYEDLLEKARGYFLERRKTSAWRNTYESSLILETILPDVLSNDSLPQKVSLQFSGGLEQTVDHFPFSATIKSGQAINVAKTGGLPVYFTAYQQHWNAAPQKVTGDFTVQSRFEKGGRRIEQLKAGEAVLLKIAVTVKADADYVMIEAPIPAGCSYNEKSQSFTNNEVHREYFKNKVSLFCSSLKKGDYTFTVSLLPRYSGRYNLNPAKAEMMYFPVFYGREGMKKITIQ